jgi:Fic family protein
MIFPNPAKIPALLLDFGCGLASAPDTPDAAFKAHLDLVSIHPFNDGNGRTARLLLNTMLLSRGYPPIAIRPEDRIAYINSIEAAQLNGDIAPYMAVMTARLCETMRDYIEAIEEAQTLDAVPILPSPD